MNTKELFVIADNVVGPQEMLTFLTSLRENLNDAPDDWENKSLQTYIEALWRALHPKPDPRFASFERRSARTTWLNISELMQDALTKSGIVGEVLHPISPRSNFNYSSFEDWLEGTATSLDDLSPSDIPNLSNFLKNLEDAVSLYDCSETKSSLSDQETVAWFHISNLLLFATAYE